MLGIKSGTFWETISVHHHWSMAHSHLIPMSTKEEWCLSLNVCEITVSIAISDGLCDTLKNDCSVIVYGTFDDQLL